MARSGTPPSIPLASIRADYIPVDGIVSRDCARIASTLVLVALLLYAAAYLARVGGLLAYPFDLDQGEGYDVNSAWLILQGRWIYTSNEMWPFYSSNYPPLFSLVLAPLLALTGPSIAAGRVLSAGAALLTAVLIGVAVKSERGTPLAATMAGLLFLASPYVYHSTPLARVNALTGCLTLAGFILCCRRSQGSLRGGALLMILAAFTKPTSIAAGISGIAFGLGIRRLSGIGSLILLGILSVLALIGLEVASGRTFILNVVQGNINPWDESQARAYWANFSLMHAGILLIALLGLWWRVGMPYWLFVAAALPTAIGSGKWGAGESYFLDLIVGLCVLTGVAVSRIGQRAVPSIVLSIVLGLQVILFAHEPFTQIVGLSPDLGLQAASLGVTPRPFDTLEADLLVSLIDRVPGPILAEDASLALMTGREVVGNATHLRNLHLSGLWQGQEMLAAITQRRFRWIILDAQLYPEPVLEAIGRSYYLYEVMSVRGVEQWVFAPGAE